jgi:hypothetical protein
MAGRIATGAPCGDEALPHFLGAGSTSAKAAGKAEKRRITLPKLEELLRENKAPGADPVRQWAEMLPCRCLLQNCRARGPELVSSLPERKVGSHIVLGGKCLRRARVFLRAWDYN